MAEVTRSPSLPSTADATPYVPVSWMAVAAVAVAGLFAATLLGLGVAAFTNKKPLLEDWLIAPPVIAIVLSFAARRIIRNSEGTRTGEKLANTAWWMALVLGLCYVAYLGAFSYAIRGEARDETERWIGHIKKGTDDDLLAAFHRTLPPGARQGVAATDRYMLEGRFRDELLVFRNTDLLKLAQRNRGEFDFVPGGVTWTYKPGSIDGTVTGTVKCPEGTFPVTISLKGVDAASTAEGGGGGRQWTVNRPQGGGFIDQAKALRTQYGWLMVVLELRGAEFGANFVRVMMTGPGNQAYVYRAFVVGGDDQGWGAVAADPSGVSQLAFAAPLGAVGNAGYADYMANHFYKGRGGVEPSAEQKARFFSSWDTFGVRPAGDKLKDGSGGPIDKEPVIALTETAVQVRVPLEIPLLGTGGKHEVARGRLVVECSDPKLLAELKQLKSEANPAQGTSSPLEELARRKFPWRVVRIESDMAPVNIIPPSGPGGPGGPGGMPGGPGGGPGGHGG